MTQKAKAAIEKAIKSGFMTTSTSHGVTTLVRHRNGSTIFMNIDNETGNRL